MGMGRSKSTAKLLMGRPDRLPIATRRTCGWKPVVTTNLVNSQTDALALPPKLVVFPVVSSLRRSMSDTGFTLVELLVSLAVLALLASTLLPALSKATRMAQGTSCLGNLRTWGQATFLFANDNNDSLPYDGAGNGHSITDAWYSDLPPMLGEPPYHEQGPWRTNAHAAIPNSVWHCPANRRRSDGRMLFHYSLNRLVNGSGASAHQLRLGAVVEPTRTVWLFDNGKRAAVAIAGNVHTNLHQGGANILFLDGHGARVPASAYWDAQKHRAVMNRPELRWNGTDEMPSAGP